MVEKWAALPTPGKRRAYLKMRATTYQDRLRRAGFSEEEIERATQELRDGLRVAMNKRRMRIAGDWQERQRVIAAVVHMNFGKSVRKAEQRRQEREASDVAG